MNRKVFVLFIGVSLLVGSIATFLLLPTQNHKPNAQVSDWNEPPALTETVETDQDKLDDLKSLGCVLVSVDGFGTFGNMFTTYNYTEFRRVSYNTKIVFYGYDQGIFYCYTIYEAVFVRCSRY